MGEGGESAILHDCPQPFATPAGAPRACAAAPSKKKRANPVYRQAILGIVVINDS
jgi:hypothetical protein